MSENQAFQTDEELYSTLHFDPLAAAEVLMGGKSYKESDAVGWLGLGLMQEKRKALDAQMLARDDTMFHNTLERYARIITDYGFKLVLDLPYFSEGWNDSPGTNEHQFTYWHDDGLLLIFTTYQEIKVNGGAVYYAWQPDSLEGSWRYTSSHDGFVDGCFVGNHDCREALIFNLENLRSHGQFLNPFPRPPRLGYSHSADKLDHKSSDFMQRYADIRQERIAMLPDYVREAIGV